MRKERYVPMAGKMFMRVEKVAEELDVSIPYAYKFIRKMNEELKKTDYVTIAAALTVSSSMGSSTQPKIRPKGAYKKSVYKNADSGTWYVMCWFTELRYADGTMISIDCTAVENEVADNMYQRSELD